MIKLIASDLDGTLLHNGEQDMPPETLKLIEKLTQKGIRFAAASGRQYDNEQRLFGNIRNNISYIAENGALCIHNGHIVSRSVLSDDLVQRIICEVRKAPNFDILLSREDCCVIEDRHPEFVNHICNVMKNTTEIVHDISKANGPFIKIAIGNLTDSHQVILDYLRHLLSMFAPEVRAVTSGNMWIDFIPPGVNKGTALLKLMEYLHIRPEECIAFGDQHNDIEMLETAGTGYAVPGAAPGVAEHASFSSFTAESVLQDLLRQTE